MNDVASNVQSGAQTAWANIAVFVPKLLLAIVILVVGYLIAKALSKVLDRVLERMGFDRLVERGGIKRMLARTNWDASGILSKLVFYFVMLFTLQLAFGVFGPNPISDLLNRIIGYLPSIFVAAVIIVVAAAIATAVKKLVDAALGGVSYGRLLATAASAAIWIVGIFAALDQLNIAPRIVNGLFYAVLAVFVGSAIIAIGGSGIGPMRVIWDRAIGRIQQEAPKLKAQAAGAQGRVEAQTEQWARKAEDVRSHAE